MYTSRPSGTSNAARTRSATWTRKEGSWSTTYAPPKPPRARRKHLRRKPGLSADEVRQAIAQAAKHRSKAATATSACRPPARCAQHGLQGDANLRHRGRRRIPLGVRRARWPRRVAQRRDATRLRVRRRRGLGGNRCEPAKGTMAALLEAANAATSQFEGGLDRRPLAV